MAGNIVWVTCESRHNFRTAEDYGEIRFITGNEYSHVVNNRTNGRIDRDIREFIKDFDPDTDYLVFTGSPMTNFKVARAVEREYPLHKVDCLGWSNQANKYSLFRGVR